MGVYRARDLINGPSLLSLARLPLAVAFVLSVNYPIAALGVLALAALSDVADGWLARTTGQATATGAAIDPITDKIFVLTVVVTLIVVGRLSVLDVLLLSTRELGELPLVVWLASSQRARRHKREYPQANIVGKLATTMQFVTVGTALFGWAVSGVMIALTALAGAIAAASYWARSIRVLRDSK